MRAGDVAVICFLLVGCAADATPLRLGSSVRVQHASSRLIEGRITYADSVAIRVVTHGTILSRNDIYIPWNKVLSIEVEAFGSRNLLRGMRNGFIAGAFTGAMMGLSAGDDQPDDFIRYSAEDKAVIFGTLLVPIFTLHLTCLFGADSLATAGSFCC